MMLNPSLSSLAVIAGIALFLLAGQQTLRCGSPCLSHQHLFHVELPLPLFLSQCWYEMRLSFREWTGLQVET